MKYDALLAKLFPDGHTVTAEDGLLRGFAVTPRGRVAVMGTYDHLAVEAESVLSLAAFVLGVVREHPGCPLLMLVDTSGQRLSRKGELLGINGYLAHLVKSLELARWRGHRLLSLVYGEAVSGGFLSFGLMADEIHALGAASVRVMNLPAMARITKLPLDRLEELSLSSPSFAPGVENFFRLGGILSVWEDDWSGELAKALQRPPRGDDRRRLGFEREGRNLALVVSERIQESRG